MANEHDLVACRHFCHQSVDTPDEVGQALTLEWSIVQSARRGPSAEVFREKSCRFANGQTLEKPIVDLECIRRHANGSVRKREHCCF